jgi:branched-chain amino acid aminotransferase
MATEFVNFDGELIATEDARIHVSSPAVRFGAHIFEGIRGYWNADLGEVFVFRLEEHLQRLRQGMKIMRYDRIASVDELTSQVLDTIRANKHQGDVGIRLSAYVVGDGFIDATGPISVMCATDAAAPRPIETKRTTAMVTSWERISDNAMPARLKCAANYQNSRLGLMQARSAGYNEAIFLTPEGKVAEGAGACLFMMRNGSPSTPPTSAGILESVTRDTMLTLFQEQLDTKADERTIDRSELYLADELFFCGSTYEVSPIVTVDGIAVGDGEIGPKTAAMWERYEAIVRGQASAHGEWRTPVYGRQPAAASGD